jgi:hypothetical protein
VKSRSNNKKSALHLKAVNRGEGGSNRRDKGKR